MPNSKSKNEKILIHYKGNEIDVTNWQSEHPGGPKVLRIFHERDVSAQFHAMHSKEAVRMIEKRAAASKNSVEPPCALDVEYLNLLEKYEQMGYFAFDFWVVLEFLWKTIAVFGPYFYALHCIYEGKNPWFATFLSAWSLYYAGWVGHDFSHHQFMYDETSKAARFSDWGAIFCGTIRGNGSLWWKRRHNTHHVSTNEVGNDPDIKTNPLLVFFTGHLYWFNRFQHYYYLPLISILDFYWHIESWQTDLKHYFSKKNKYESTLAFRDIIGLIYFDVWFTMWGVSRGFLYPCVCLWLSGFATALIVFATHYAEERLDCGPDVSFVEQTVRTSRNIKGLFGEDMLWSVLTCNLSLQKEHHLFPRMPNGNVWKVRADTRKLVRKFGFEYTEDTLFECVAKALRILKETTKNKQD